MKMRQQGFEPCAACGGTGIIHQVDQLRPFLPTIGECMTCEGRGFTQIVAKPVPEEPKRQTIGDIMMEDPVMLENVSRMMRETGATADECKIALTTWAGDYDRALKWMDDSRLGG
jgi:hypothetical protein